MPRDWNQVFADPNYLEAPPDPLLMQAVEILPPGRALDLACGAGRHALYLARLGWQVLAVDSSPAALARLRAQPGASTVQTRLADLAAGQFTIEPDVYDLIADTLYLQRDLFPQIRAGIRPGGTFVGAIHVSDDSAQHPCNPDFQLAPGELRRLFDGWKIVYYSESRTSETARQLARIIARRA